MKTPVAMIQQVISNETLQNVHSLKEFESYTKATMANRMTNAIEDKMKFSSEKDTYNNLVVRGEVVIMSPREYRSLMIKLERLEIELNSYKSSRPRVQDTGGTIPNRPMTEEENRSFWGIFG